MLQITKPSKLKDLGNYTHTLNDIKNNIEDVPKILEADHFRNRENTPVINDTEINNNTTLQNTTNFSESSTKYSLNNTESTTPTNDGNMINYMDNVTTTNETPKSSIPVGLYPTANYENDFINNVMLTTESNNNNDLYLLPKYDEIWRNFSKNNIYFKSEFDGFRPLAGLYYDGFLHKKIIKKQGWSPFLIKD